MPADISIPDVAVGFFVELRFSELLRPRLHGQDDHRFPGLRVDNGGICVLHKIQLFGLFGEAVNVSVFKFQQLAIVIIRDLVILSPLQGDDILFSHIKGSDTEQACEVRTVVLAVTGCQRKCQSCRQNGCKESFHDKSSHLCILSCCPNGRRKNLLLVYHG